MTKESPNLSAPRALKIDTELEAHGDKRIDPYFWMRLTDDQKIAKEPDNQTLQVLDYLNQENSYTQEVLKSTDEFQKELFQEIIGRIKKNDESVPYFNNEYWYYTRYEEGKEYPIYCRKKSSLKADEEILLDVNALAYRHDYFHVASLLVSPNNELLAYATDQVSRRIYTIHFKNLITGEVLEDTIENAEGGGAWANDNSTFFYTAKNRVSLLSEKIYRHTLGSDQSSDVMVYHEKDPSYYIGVSKSKSQQYIIITNHSTLSNDYRILSADEPTGKFRQFSARESVHEYSIKHYQNKFYIVTNWEAQNFRLMETPEGATDKENWKEVISHRTDVLLNDVDIFANHLVLSERKNGLTQIRVIDQSSKEEHYIEFKDPAYVAFTSTNKEFDTSQLRFIYSSLTTPTSTIDYDMNLRTKMVKKQEEVVGGHSPEDYISERILVTVRDQEKVPVSLVYHKDTHKTRETPLLLYAYGSYGASSDPYFSSVRLSLLNRGFIFAIAHIRGGQEMGRRWYDEGKMFKKINTFNDFIDCANYLIDHQYTSEKHLYALGGSAGGLLMGAILNMAPQLFNGIIAAVPFVDVISTMMDETIPLTTNEFNEWGNPKNKDSYNYMKTYSPYDNIEAKDYPHLLVTTGLFDSQVQYWEPAKWVAKLREYKTDNNILLLHTNMEAGHGGASGRFQRYKETALEYAFFLYLEGFNKA